MGSLGAKVWPHGRGRRCGSGFLCPVGAGLTHPATHACGGGAAGFRAPEASVAGPQTRKGSPAWTPPGDLAPARGQWKWVPRWPLRPLSLLPEPRILTQRPRVPMGLADSSARPGPLIKDECWTLGGFGEFTSKGGGKTHRPALSAVPIHAASLSLDPGTPFPQHSTEATTAPSLRACLPAPGAPQPPVLLLGL